MFFLFENIDFFIPIYIINDIDKVFQPERFFMKNTILIVISLILPLFASAQLNNPLIDQPGVVTFISYSGNPVRFPRNSAGLSNFAEKAFSFGGIEHLAQTIKTEFSTESLELLKIALERVASCPSSSLEKEFIDNFDFSDRLALLEMADYFKITELNFLQKIIFSPIRTSDFKLNDKNIFSALENLNSLPNAKILALELIEKNKKAFAHLKLATIEHRRRIENATFSPDGTKVATTGYDGFSKISDATTGQLISSISHGGAVLTATFSPDGTKVLTASTNDIVKICSASTGAVLLTIEQPDGSFIGATFSHDGTKIITISDHRTARIFDSANGKSLAQIRHKDQLTNGIFTHDNTKVVTTSDKGTIKISDIFSGRTVTVIRHQDTIFDVSISPDDTKIVTASADKTAKISDAATGKLIATIQHSDRVFRAAFSPDGTKIITASNDTTAKISDAITGQLMTTVQHLSGLYKAASFSSSGTKVVTASYDGMVKISDATTGKLIAQFEHDQWCNITSAAFSPCEKKIITASNNGTAKIHLLAPTFERLDHIVFAILIENQKLKNEKPLLCLTESTLSADQKDYLKAKFLIQREKREN